MGSLIRASYSGEYASECWDDEHALDRCGYDLLATGPYRVGREIRRSFDTVTVEQMVELLAGSMGELLAAEVSRELAAPEDRLNALLNGLRDPD